MDGERVDQNHLPGWEGSSSLGTLPCPWVYVPEGTLQASQTLNQAGMREYGGQHGAAGGGGNSLAPSPWDTDCNEEKVQMAEPIPRGFFVTQWSPNSLDPETQWMKRMGRRRVLGASAKYYHLGPWGLCPIPWPLLLLTTHWLATGQGHPSLGLRFSSVQGSLGPSSGHD